MEQSNDGVPGTESAQPVGKRRQTLENFLSLYFFIKLSQYSTCRACSGNVSTFEERLQEKKDVIKWSQNAISYVNIALKVEQLEIQYIYRKKVSCMSKKWNIIGM